MVKTEFEIQRFSDVIHGTASGDYGSNIADNTQVYGLAGNDTIETNGSKNVLLIGGSGNDVIQMTGGSGTLNGGVGADTFKFNYSSANTISAVLEDIDPANDRLVINYTGSGTPNINYSTVGRDVVLTDDAGYFNVTLKGYREANDYFDGTAHENVWEILKLVNQERETQGLNWLTLSQDLTDGAAIRAIESEQKYEHVRPDGSAIYTVLKSGNTYVGENLYASPTTPEAAMEGWMNSTGHRANILNSTYKRIGVGYFYKSNSDWKHYWAQMFSGEFNSHENVSFADILSTAVTLSANDVTKTTSTLGNISSLKHTTISGTSGADLLVNGRWYGEKATQNVEILGLGGNDTISNSGSNSVLDGGAGNDLIYSGYYYYDGGGFYEESYNGDYDDDNGSSNVTIKGGAGLDTIKNTGAAAVISGGSDNDSISNTGDSVRVNSDSGNDFIINGRWYGEKGGVKVSINGGDGADTITSSGSNSVLDGGAGNDEIYNGYYFYENGRYYESSYNGDYDDENGSSNVTINGGAGEDVIDNNGKNASISGGAGIDMIYVNAASRNTTVNGGADSDYISLVSGSSNSLIQYAQGDGNDYIYELGTNDTVHITSGNISSVNVRESLVILNVGSGAIHLDRMVGKSFKLKLGSSSAFSTIISAEVSNELTNYTKNSIVSGTGDADTIRNYAGGAKIYAGAGNDYIYSSTQSDYMINGDYGYVTIDAGSGNDTIEIFDPNTKVIGGYGNDLISLRGSWSNNVIQYSSGDGNDTVYGYNASDTISITGGTYTKSTVGNNVILKVGSGAMTLVGASGETLNIAGGDGNSGSSGVTLSNSKKNTVISGTSYADSIYNSGANVTINSGAGNDSINNAGNNVLIDAGAGNDSTWGGGDKVTINGGAGNDRLELWGTNSVINTGDGNNEVFIHGNNVTVNGSTGKDFVEIWDDYSGFPLKAVGRAKVSTGADNDFVRNYGAGATINTGAGNDTIQIISGYTYNSTRSNVYQYAQGDGNDTILGYNSGDSIQITRGSYTTMTSGNDIIISVGSGKITLKDAKNTTLNIDGDAETTLPAGISVKGAVLTATTTFTGSEIDLADYASTVTKVNASALSRGVSVVGTAAANSLKGGKGADTIFGGAGNDTVSLGGGADVYVYQSGNDLIQDYKVGEDKIKLASASITGSSLSGSNVVLKTSAGNLTVKGAKNKKITVIDSNGAETSNVYPLSILPAGLSYDSTKKTLTVGTSYSGVAIDLANFDKATKTVAASSYSKKIQITGNNLGNTILGGKANDTLTGGTKADTIYGGAGADKIYGEAGADKLFGGAGNDTLYGGAGNDTLTGGDGKDFFVYGSGDGNDIIADYTAGTDKIKISSGSISKTAYVSNNVVFTVGRGTLTVRNGRGKKITITDASGKTSTKTYKNGAVYGSSATWFTADDTNFISGETNLDAVTAEKYSVTQLTAPDAENIFAQDIQPVYSTDKTK